MTMAKRAGCMFQISAILGRGKFIRGYSMSASGGAAQFPAFATDLPGFGSAYKKQVKSLYPAYARVWMSGGEMRVRKEDVAHRDAEGRDEWGIKVLKFQCSLCENDPAIYEDFVDH